MAQAPDLWEFARVGTGKIAAITSTLSSESKSQGPRELLLNRFAVALLDIHETLKEPCIGQSKTVPEAKLVKLLTRLEGICVSSRNPTSQVSKPAHNRILPQRQPLSKRFPALYKLSRTHPRSERPQEWSSWHDLNVFSYSRKLRSCVQELEKFLPPAEKEDEETLPQAEKEESTKIWARLTLDPFLEEPIPKNVTEQFHTIVRHYSLCACMAKSGQQHVGRLELKERMHQMQEDDFLFDTLYTAAIERDALQSSHWQYLRFLVTKASTVNFDPGSDRVQLQDKNREHEEPIPRNKFCSLLNHGIIRLWLKVRNKQLLKLRKLDSDMDSPAQPGPGKSLASTLKTHKLKTRDKLLLSYILAKSTWQLYGSGWLRPRWTTETIHFMVQKALRNADDPDEPCFNPTSPYFAFCFDKLSQTTKVDELFLGCVAHNFPHILALGVILVEICRKTPLGDPQPGTSQEQIINNSLCYAKNALKSKDWPDLDIKDQDVKNAFRNAVATCFNSELFEIQNSNGEETSKAEIETRRDILYNNVVGELGKILSAMDLIDEDGNCKRDGAHIYSLSSPDKYSIQRQQLANMRNAIAPCSRLTLTSNSVSSGYREMLDNQQVENTKENADRYAEWIHDLISVYDRYPCEPSVKLLKPSGPRIAAEKHGMPLRIGVIDTGCHFKHWGIDDSKRIIHTCCSDCLDNWRECPRDHLVDKDGHGTHIVGLLLDCNRDTQLFVVKLDEADVDNLAANDASQRKVAKAIELVVDAWDVDIVSLSFGYSSNASDGYGEIKTAIASASKKALIFAAARNCGLNKSRAYPAQEPNVFCVHSTTNYGIWSQWNPGPWDSSLSLNLATIGTGVLSYWPTDDKCEETQIAGMKIRSGTSFACPIAASIAAYLIMFACAHLDRWQAEKMRTFDGMNAVLRKVCEESKDKRESERQHSYLHLSVDENNLFGKSLDDIKKAIGEALQPVIQYG